MVNVVLDTNVLVASMLSPHGPPAQVLELVADGAAHLILSPAILAEYEDVLSRKKFGFSAPTVKAVVDGLKKLATEIVPSEAVRACKDPGDDKFLECAAAAGAAYLNGEPKAFSSAFQRSPRRLAGRFSQSDRVLMNWFHGP